MAEKLKYNGYLLDEIEFIRTLSDLGISHKKIAGALYASGVRSPWDAGDPDRDVGAMTQMIRYVLTPKKPKQRATRIVQDWQTWTPEMQEAEICMEYYISLNG